MILREKKIRIMIAQSYSYNKDKLIQLLKTAKSISLTTNLWSSYSKYEYLGLTAIWINQNFEIIDVLLKISYFLVPHTGKAIADTIKKAIKKWEIENNVVLIVTDNGANTVRKKGNRTYDKSDENHLKSNQNRKESKVR